MWVVTCIDQQPSHNKESNAKTQHTSCLSGRRNRRYGCRSERRRGRRQCRDRCQWRDARSTCRVDAAVHLTRALIGKRAARRRDTRGATHWSRWTNNRGAVDGRTIARNTEQEIYWLTNAFGDGRCRQKGGYHLVKIRTCVSSAQLEDYTALIGQTGSLNTFTVQKGDDTLWKERPRV